MEQNSQEIVDKIEGIIENKYKNLEDQLKSIKRNLAFFTFGFLTIILLAGCGVPLLIAALIAFGIAFISEVYHGYCEKKSNS